MHKKTLYNFLARCGILLVLSLFLYSDDMWRGVFMAVAISAGFTLFDVLIGPANNPRQQSERITEMLAGHNITTTKDKLGRALLLISLPLSGLFLTATLLSLITSEDILAWLVGVIVALLIYISAPRIARRSLQSR